VGSFLRGEYKRLPLEGQAIKFKKALDIDPASSGIM
jgi:hypothetical protein